MIKEITAQELIERIDDYDLIIDVRSPHEFRESHIPDARNYYALNDEEYEEVGTTYKQISPFEARVKGAAYVCKNAIEHIAKLYPEFTPKHRIAIYCARGGMRSGSLATIFSNIGYHIDRVKGGYKAYRTAVLEYMQQLEPRQLIVLGGNTGCGKSDLLAKLDNKIDLEGLANHYGSVFGAVHGAQPGMKMFQNSLIHAIRATDASRPVFIESESKQIGRLTLPKALSAMMREGFRVEITAPIEQRTARIVRMYEGIDAAFFHTAMKKIVPYIKRSVKDEATCAFEKGDLVTVAEILLGEYYDVVYKKAANVNLQIDNDDESRTLAVLKELQREKAKLL